MRSVRLSVHDTQWGRRAVTLHYPEWWWEWLTMWFSGLGQRHIDGFGRDCRLELHELEESDADRREEV